MKIREEPWIVLGKCLAINCARTILPQETSSIVTIRLTLARLDSKDLTCFAVC